MLNLDWLNGAWRNHKQLVKDMLLPQQLVVTWLYLELSEWSLKDSEQLLEDVLLPQQLVASCLPWTRWMEPEGFWTAAWGCTALATAFGGPATPRCWSQKVQPLNTITAVTYCWSKKENKYLSQIQKITAILLNNCIISSCASTKKLQQNLHVGDSLNVAKKTYTIKNQPCTSSSYTYGHGRYT